MKKYFVVSDVHSFYDELMEALNEKEFDINNPEHILISCGDLFDRGPKSQECLDFIVGLIKQNRSLCVEGNHEDMTKDILARKSFQSNDIHNGADKTFDQLCTDNNKDLSAFSIIQNVEENKDLKLYLDSCKNYYEIGNNIFVHGWIPVHISYGMFVDTMLPIEDWKNGDWNQARWVNGMKAWDKGIKLEGKTIWCGHFHASWGNAYLHNDGVEYLEPIHTSYIDSDTGKLEPHVNYNTFIDEGIKCLDACTVLSHKVNCEVFYENQ